MPNLGVGVFTFDEVFIPKFESTNEEVDKNVFFVDDGNQKIIIQ